MTPGSTRNQAVVAGALAFICLVAYSPALAAPAFSARAGAVLVSAAGAAWWLLATRPRLEPVELAALAVAAWAAISAVGARSSIAWTGTYPRGTGAVMWCAAGVMFVAARRLSPPSRDRVSRAVVAAAVLSALVALVQLGVDTGIWSFALVDGRAHGLMGNPVFLGALGAAAVPLATSIDRRPIMTGVATALCAAGVQASGSRIALAAAVATALGAALVSAVTWRAAARAAGLTLMAVLAGVVLSLGVASVGASTSDSATERIASSEAAASGFGQRAGAWRDGLAAAAERPIAGWGPGRFRAATAPHRTLSDARSVAPGTVFDDAHNLFVQQAATTGFVGLGLLVAWLVLTARSLRWRSPAAWAALGLGATQLLQPEHVALTPLLFVMAALATTGAVPDGQAESPPRRRWSAHSMGGTLTALALSVAIVLVVGDAAARTAVLDFRPVDAARASRLLRPWAPPKLLEARVQVFHDRTGVEGSAERALELAYQAAAREPDLPPTHTLVARLAARLGRLDEALAATDRALAADPWSADALGARAEVLRGLDRTDPAAACDVARRAARTGSNVTVAAAQAAHVRCLSAT